jgi:hypothetical protein
MWPVILPEPLDMRRLKMIGIDKTVLVVRKW